jgi:hypothetical protein
MEYFTTLRLFQSLFCQTTTNWKFEAPNQADVDNLSES